MPSLIALAKTNYKDISHYRKINYLSFLNIIEHINFKKISFRSLLGILALISILFYLYQVNNLSVQSFQIRELENKSEKLKEVNKELRLGVAQAQSIINLNEFSNNFKMEKINQVEYISPILSTVAVK